jgi:hypothetical protein
MAMLSMSATKAKQSTENKNKWRRGIGWSFDTRASQAIFYPMHPYLSYPYHPTNSMNRIT